MCYAKTTKKLGNTLENQKDHILVVLGKERFNKPEENSIHLVHDPNINAFLNVIDQYPHAYVLACMMDRQIKAERVWTIPWEVK